MEKYQNLSGRSGVSRYEYGDGWIRVEFYGKNFISVR